MNTVKLMGNVGREVTVREFDNGKVASFSVATNETYLNKNQEEVTNTTWHTVVAWGKLAEQCERLVAKGKFISVEGKINYRQYQNKEDQTVRITEIVAYKIEEGKKKEVA
ncbi:single-stranded DNA-binding protein [Arundinibacter roseus]|uniref:Single-stranded DNA-binding protein n=1 Tax=Arundinibacter roseus TaxID=2070510 RepID=A0A4R4KEH5_9BACT|nr:single-stranded DNA-binding protein [Arundinibacter roseus]TDB65242.1 single-stranded DNA-binding protein [Arundinibacter roseus]